MNHTEEVVKINGNADKARSRSRYDQYLQTGKDETH